MLPQYHRGSEYRLVQEGPRDHPFLRNLSHHLHATLESGSRSIRHPYAVNAVNAVLCLWLEAAIQVIIRLFTEAYRKMSLTLEIHKCILPTGSHPKTPLPENIATWQDPRKCGTLPTTENLQHRKMTGKSTGKTIKPMPSSSLALSNSSWFHLASHNTCELNNRNRLDNKLRLSKGLSICCTLLLGCKAGEFK